MSQYLWLLGAFVSIIGSVCSNLGVNVQKYAFMKEAEVPIEKQRAYYKMPLWTFGLFLVILGAMGDFTALGLAAQSIVAPIGATTLIANVFFAHFWLKEPLSKLDLLGTLCILIGSVLAVGFGDHNEKSYTVEDLLEYYKREEFIVYASACTLFVLGLLYFIVLKADPIKAELEAKKREYDLAESQKDLTKATKLDEELTEIETTYSKWERFHPFALCAISGTFGGQNILFGKMVAEMLGSTFQGNSQMGHWATYVFIVCMFTCIFIQLHFLAKALEFFPALYVVPVFQCFFITVSTLAGAAYFGEFDTFGWVQWIMFPLGIALTLYGVKLLSMRTMAGDHDAADRKQHLSDIKRIIEKDDNTKVRRRSLYANTLKTKRNNQSGRSSLQAAQRKSDMLSPFAALGVVPLQKFQRDDSISDDIELSEIETSLL